MNAELGRLLGLEPMDLSDEELEEMYLWHAWQQHGQATTPIIYAHA